jgi:hypothetical protein
MKINRHLVQILGLGALAIAVLATQTTTAQGSKGSGITQIKDTEHPARSAVQASCSVTWTDAAGVKACDLMTVPAGKRLVIEFATVIASTQGTDAIRTASIATALAEAPLYSRLLLGREEGDPSYTFWVATHPLRAYSDPGSLVRGFSAFVGNAADSGQHCDFTITGYLVDVQ